MSNFKYFLSSGEAPIYKYLYHYNINVSLGTDVSGGFDYSILQIIKHAVLVSHHLNMHKSNTTTNTTTKNDVDERLLKMGYIWLQWVEQKLLITRYYWFI